VEIHNFPYDYIKEEVVSVKLVAKYLIRYLEKNNKGLRSSKITSIKYYLKKIMFYMNLEEFGYDLILKPVKIHMDIDGVLQKKANCDVDITLFLLRYMDHFDRVIVLSGDGDFLPVLKYLRENKKEVLVFARSKGTAREIKQFAGDEFINFESIRINIEYR
jgi:uncharacterized LabA/DUF88 family protein